MSKKLVNVIHAIIIMLLGTIIMTAFLMCLMTPEKTKSGDYTNVYKYWTDDAYLCQNFCNCDCSNVK